MKTLLRGGHVITMDRELGDVEHGDVLIEDGRIAAVERGLDAAADEVIDVSGSIVLPGLIDSHIHLWQTPLRGLASEVWAGEYFPTVHPLSGRYRPQDMHAATYGGAIELLSHGVTTVFDFCHSVNSPQHADASVDALQEAGIRALFGYSFRDRPEVPERAFHSHEERVRDAHRVRSERLADEAGLVQLAIALNNLEHVDEETFERELACARELGALATVHSLLPWEIGEVHRRGLLRPDLMWVHVTPATDHELELLREHGGSIAATPEIEFAMEGLYPLTGRCVRRGVPTTLGVDVASAVSADLLVQMRLAFDVERMLDGQHGRMFGREPARKEGLPTLSARAVLGLGTIDAARALGIDGRTGSLTPGKDADVLVLGTEPFGMGLGDPAAHVILQSSAANVDHVLVAGRPRVRDGELVDVDVARMRRQLDEAREHVVGPR